MYKNKKIIAIIPARAGSKGLPDKNIIDLNGKPLISWTILQARDSDLIDRAIVTTDSKRIAFLSEKYGADVPFIRPDKLAEDTTPMIDTLEHALNSIEETYDVVVLLEPTSPLRKKSDIDRGIKKLIDGWDNFDSLVSLGKIHLENPEICKHIKEGDLVEPVMSTNTNITCRQQLSPAYFPYGVIYASKTFSLLNSKSFYQERTTSMTIDRWQNYEIDDIYDLICIRSIASDLSLDIGGR
jgi:CMP-N,N'-diacetyllegionaminic acid synthase